MADPQLKQYPIQLFYEWSCEETPYQKECSKLFLEQDAQNFDSIPSSYTKKQDICGGIKNIMKCIP
jgi:hypothetical protein